MAGNSQRRGAVRKRGKSTPAGSGGRVRHSLEGKGPTPKAEDRPYHKAYRKRKPDESPITGGDGRRAGGSGSSEWGSRSAGGSSWSADGGSRAGGRSRSGGGSSRSAGGSSRSTGGNPRATGGRRPGVRSQGAEWVFGRNPVYEALSAGVPAKQMLIAEGVERDSRLRDILTFAAENGVPLMQATRADLDRLAAGGSHQGVAIRIPPYEYADADDLRERGAASGTGVVVALDSVTDPHNLGAIIRSAAAFGALGVMIPERRSAQLNATSWKTSAGAAARLPVARVKNLNQALRAFADAGFQVVGLDGESETPITEISTAETPTVLVVGSEGQGLSRLVSQNCDLLASVPISHAVESLNASVAAAIALYELAR